MSSSKRVARRTAYALFPRDEHYHVARPKLYRTLCGLPTISRKGLGEEYRPPARVTEEEPPASLYRPCPKWLAEIDYARSRRGR